ncbi:MAG: hypothetical protein JWM99_566 [Verrucomicrobiales bacterium]|nr:hypothetical protein [Verrucomicrobiales bacterium]
MAAGFVSYEIVTFRQGLVEYVTTISEIIAANSSGSLGFESQSDAAEVLASLSSNRYVKSAVLFDQEGKVFASFPPDISSSNLFLAQPLKEGYRFTGDKLICVKAVTKSGVRQGTLYAVASLEPMYHRLRMFGLVVGVLLIGSVIVAFILSNSLQEKIASPILALAGTARTISEQRNYGVRAPKGASDEVGILTDAFNHMLNQIEERNMALRENSERLNLALEASGTGTWDWNIPSDRITWDRYLDQLLGGANGAEGRTFAEFLALVQPEDQARFQNLAVSSIQESREFVADFRVIWPNGSLHHLSTRGKAFKDAGGTPLRMAGVMIDTTDTERAEQALRDSEQRYRSLVSAITSVVWISDPEGAFKVSQSSWQAYTGQAFNEHRGFGWMQALHPDDRERIRGAWLKARSMLSRFEAEGRLWNAGSQSYRHFITRAVPILEGTGKVREWVGTVTDVHDRKLAEDEIHRLNSELEQRVLARTAELATTNQELESFTYSVSHDLRSPLRHIDAYAQILQEEFGEAIPGEAKQYLSRIRNGTQNMGHLVDDLLNLARVGRQELNFKPANLGLLVEEVIEELGDETIARKIEWKIEPLPTVACDPGLIKQVFANLISNAVKYTRTKPVATIEIGLTNARNQTAIYVRDNGVGFNMKYVSKLFGVFQRLHKAEDFEGTGVGLATVQRIVRKHGGEIWVEAEIDKGATFYFTLKTLQAQEASSESGA